MLTPGAHTSGIIDSAVRDAISRTVADFQSDGERFWEERDVHWSLFHYLKEEPLCKEDYPTQLLRAEFPTLKTFGSIKPARGHYDLALLDVSTYFSPDVQVMRSQSSWEEFLRKIQLTFAIEIKLWLSRSRTDRMEERVAWDVQKLTEDPHNIQRAFFLNFVQLDFRSEHLMVFYTQLRDYLVAQKVKHQSLNILCVPSDISIQPGANHNWL